jgi:hypothetical protein
MKKELEYRTYDELLSAVLSDVSSIDQEGLANPQDLIKIAQKINKELGLKLLRDKHTVLEVSKNKVRLPLDLYVLNYAFVLHDKEIIQDDQRQGIHTEERIVPKDCIPGFPSTCGDTELPNSVDDCIRITECGETYELVQTIGKTSHRYKTFSKLYLDENPLIDPEFQKLLTQDNILIHNPNAKQSGYIKQGWLFTNFDEGKVYLNYSNNMEDDEGNLLVLDHPIINEYYETSFKVRILENMMLQGEQVGDMIKYFDQRRRNARIEARNVVFTPEFTEIQQVWQNNRRNKYNRYYSLFKTQYPY